jgi:hypothetical protein
VRHLKLLLTLTMAITAIAVIAITTAAQAEEGFLPLTSFTGKSGAGTLETLTGEKITCASDTILEGKMEIDSHGKIASVHFKGCKAVTKIGEFPANSLGDEKEVILATNLLWLVCLNGGVFYVVLEFPAVHVEVPAVGDLFTFTGSVIAEILLKAGVKAKIIEIHFKQKAGDPEPKECTGADGTVKKPEMKVELGTTKTDGALLGLDTLEAEKETELHL